MGSLRPHPATRHLAKRLTFGGWPGHVRRRAGDDLLASHSHLVVSGTVSNQGRFYDRFDSVVLISAPRDVLLERVSARTNNPYGSSPEHRAEIARYVDTVEPLLRSGADLELDGRRPTSELADAIETLLTATGGR